MADDLVRLIWDVDQYGYDIVTRERRDFASPLFGSPLHGRRDRTMPLNDGLWSRGLAGFGRALAWPSDSDTLDFIVPRGGKTEQYEAGLLEDPIYLDLANSKH